LPNSSNKIIIKGISIKILQLMLGSFVCAYSPNLKFNTVFEIETYNRNL
jgi:hypothetical protein